MTDSMTLFFLEKGRWDAVDIARMETSTGARIPSNGKVKVNTQVRLKVKVKKECHLYILGWDQTNSILTVLFPGAGENSRTGVGDFYLPHKGYFRADPPAGYNWVKAVATKENIGLISTGEKLLEDPKSQNEVVRKIRALGPDGWGSCSVGYYIEN